VAQVVRVDTSQAFSAAQTLQGRQNLDIDPDLTVSGNVTSNGGYFVVDRVGDADSARLLLLNDDSEQGDITFRTGASGDRWKILSTAAAESGSDVGSNFQIARYNDSAVFQDYPVIIYRSTGETNFANNVLINNGGYLRINSSNENNSADIWMDANTSESATIFNRTGTSNRWSFGKTSTAESGSDAGSDFAIGRYNDSGAYQDNPIGINRSTGVTQFSNTVLINNAGYLLIDSSTANEDCDIYMYANTSEACVIHLCTGSSTRWRIYKSDAAESGSEVGSDFILSRYNDSGAYQDNPIEITRSTGVTNFSNNVWISGSSITHDYSSGAGDVIHFMRANTSENAFIRFQTGTSNRWAIVKNDAAESGSDVGSKFLIQGYTDAGAWKWDALVINRNTGKVEFNSGDVSINNGTLIVDRSNENVGAYFFLDANTSQAGNIYNRTGTSNRWSFGKTSTAESGSDAGSDFAIARYNDAGTWQEDAIKITRSTGLIAFANGMDNVLPIRGVSPQVNFYQTDYAATANNHRWRTYSDGANFSIQVGNASSLSSCYRITSALTGTRGATEHRCYLQGSTKATLNSTGMIFTNNCTAVDFITTSDGTLKSNLHVIDDALHKVNSINGYTFQWSENQANGAGVVAQEVENILPSIVNDNGVNNKKSVAVMGMVGLLVEAVKELTEKVEKLEDR